MTIWTSEPFTHLHLLKAWLEFAFAQYNCACQANPHSRRWHGIMSAN